MPVPLISTLCRKKSVGRLARSVEMMTHRPVMGSFLNSGKDSSCAENVYTTVPFQSKLMIEKVCAAQITAQTRLCAGAQWDARRETLELPGRQIGMERFRRGIRGEIAVRLAKDAAASHECPLLRECQTDLPRRS